MIEADVVDCFLLLFFMVHFHFFLECALHTSVMSPILVHMVLFQISLLVKY